MPYKSQTYITLQVKIVYLIFALFFLSIVTYSLAQEVVEPTTQNTEITNTTVPVEEPIKSNEIVPIVSESTAAVSPTDPLDLGGSKKSVKSPITINGDNVEYGVDSKEVTAAGNVSIVSEGAKLTCEKITVNTETKDAIATGNVRLEDKKGVIEGEKVIYNFVKKSGTIINAHFMSTPYFGKSEKIDKVSDDKFIAYDGYMSSCSYDKPHYRIKAKTIDFYPGNKVEAKKISLTTGQVRQIPLMYLPQFNQSLKDRIMKIQVMPGKRKDWGYYMLTAYRYNINENLKGRIFLDYRTNFGIAEGFDANYKNKYFGKGDFKFYYTQERDKSGDVGDNSDIPKVFQRYFIRWRHKWDIDKQTNLLFQYYKIVDSKRALFGSTYNFLKDYFPREYDKDPTPLSYVQFHHAFSYSSFDMVFQKRVNPWYSQLEKLPEINFSMPSIEIIGTPLYLENTSQFAEYKYKNAVPSPSTADIKMWRGDTYNKVSLPAKVSIFSLTPYVADRTTYYNSDNQGSAIFPRTIFYSGADLSTKLYRVFDLNTNFMGLNINGLRHILTPTIAYGYTHKPTISSTRLKQIDAIDAIDTTNGTTIEISNKLQTKRDGKTIELVDFRINTGYNVYSVEPLTQVKNKGGLSDFVLNLDAKPYTWLNFHSDADYSSKLRYFNNANVDLTLGFPGEKSFSIGHRYERKNSKEMTFSSTWRFSPIWKISVMERYQFADLKAIDHGLRYQQYTILRDLHCWTAELSWTQENGKGSTVWLLFRLKAFPEIEFDLNQSYNEPKGGKQSY